ncbi:MAG: sensor domain-containing diguanylate cyclase [Candidatus Andeanibacterium colombiense]|uniref:diguanylate cyclase n=1 Tax=Candidatus Andeanibacterium colombiense TaxID=3121345 RepID=A0AAJ5X2H7_9SPHN|nr:MAG: sensor domain-containing diguanylate cyclase [Sphingomonadaceae bacterium]
MRLATITNWAYGSTVLLTLASATAMLIASDAQGRERAAIEKFGDEIFQLSDRARQYINTGDPTYRTVYTSGLAQLGQVENRIRHIGDAGATPQELATLKDALHWADTLHDEQHEAIAAYDAGDAAYARQILFGGEYERELDRIEQQVLRFQDQLDLRAESEVRIAAEYSALWKTVSEIVLALTGLLFLCVLYFVFKQRVLRPVVKLSDVVNRLAAQDYAAEPPEVGRIDEIGDMAQAIRIFRDNGLERQRLERERDADQAIRDLLARMTQRMQGCDTLGDLQEVVQRFVPEIAPTRAGRLYLIDKARNAVVEACDWLEPTGSLPEFAPSTCWALRRGMPHRPSGAASGTLSGGEFDIPCAHLVLHDGILSDTLCLPLTAQREMLGLLYFEPRADGAGAGAAAPEIYLEMLAETIGLAIANLRLRDALREMAMADPLTGLANRRQLDQVLETLHRSPAPVSCLMVDVDHFKRFNDVFGHDAGDAVLREVGALLRGAVREPEFAFRYGGEEFLVLLPGLEAKAAQARAEEVRAKIAALRLTVAGEELGPITVSVGIANAPLHCGLDRLVPAADAALLHAKARGRNRIETARARDGKGPADRAVA